MRTWVRIWIRSADPASRVEKEFRDLFPFGRYRAGFQVDLSPDDPRIADVLAAFKARGIPKVGRGIKNRPPVEYYCDYHRSYDPEDFQTARYLQLKHEVLVSYDAERDESGRIRIDAARLHPELRLGCVLYQGIVVSDAIRIQMLKEGLIGPKFNGLLLSGPRAVEAQDRFWELTSSIILPPMPRDRLITHENTPNDYEHVAGITDGEFIEKEIHYSEAAVGAIEPFDFAVTHEIFCGPGWKETYQGERRAIGSQRFRQFCIAHDISMSWIPVRLDPELAASQSPQPSPLPPVIASLPSQSAPATPLVPPVIKQPHPPIVHADIRESARTASPSTHAIPALQEETRRGFMQIINQQLDKDFRMVICDVDAPNAKWLDDFEAASGFPLPDDFRRFVRAFGAVHIEAKESVWPRASPGDVAQFWSFLHGLSVFGCSGRVPEDLDIRIQTPTFRNQSRTEVVPFLKVVADPDVYCFDARGAISRWDHEAQRLEGQAGTFIEIFTSELEKLKQRKERRVREGAGRK